MNPEEVIVLDSDDEDRPEQADLVVGPTGTAVPLAEARKRGLATLGRGVVTKRRLLPLLPPSIQVRRYGHRGDDAIRKALSQHTKPVSKLDGFALFKADILKMLPKDPAVSNLNRIISSRWRSANPTVRVHYDALASHMNDVQSSRHPSHSSAATATAAVAAVANDILATANMEPRPGKSASALKVASISSLMSFVAPAPRVAIPALVKLPSSTTISRVEPEITILAESSSVSRRLDQFPPGLSVERLRSSTAPTQTRRASSLPVTLPAGTSSILSTPGLRFSDSHREGRERPRQVGTFEAANLMCRLCFQLSSRAQPIRSRPEVVHAVSHTLGDTLDVDKDEREGYPTHVCWKCASTVISFSTYKQLFVQAQCDLRHFIRRRQEALRLPAEMEAVEDTSLPTSPPLQLQLSTTAPAVIESETAAHDDSSEAPEAQSLDFGKVLVQEAADETQYDDSNELFSHVETKQEALEFNGQNDSAFFREQEPAPKDGTPLVDRPAFPDLNVPQPVPIKNEKICLHDDHDDGISTAEPETDPIQISSATSAEEATVSADT